MPKFLQLTKWHRKQKNKNGAKQCKLGKLAKDKMYLLIKKIYILKMNNIRQKKLSNKGKENAVIRKKKKLIGMSNRPIMSKRNPLTLLLCLPVFCLLFS